MNPAPRSPRVASLLPSATEIVCALGLERALVGISHECDHPPGVAGTPVLTSTKVAPSAHSRDIDRDVRRIVRDALAVYDIDLAALERAAPDVIVTQDLCDVCAVSFDAVCAATKAVAPSAHIVSLHPTRLADIWSDIERVGAALDREEHARDVVRRLRDRVDAVRERAQHTRQRPRTLTIEWIDPVMIGGTWMPEPSRSRTARPRRARRRSCADARRGAARARTGARRRRQAVRGSRSSARAETRRSRALHDTRWPAMASGACGSPTATRSSIDPGRGSSSRSRSWRRAFIPRSSPTSGTRSTLRSRCSTPAERQAAWLRGPLRPAFPHQFGIHKLLFCNGLSSE